MLLFIQLLFVSWNTIKRKHAYQLFVYYYINANFQKRSTIRREAFHSSAAHCPASQRQSRNSTPNVSKYPMGPLLYRILQYVIPWDILKHTIGPPRHLWGASNLPYSESPGCFERTYRLNYIFVLFSHLLFSAYFSPVDISKSIRIKIFVFFFIKIEFEILIEIK